MNLFRLLQARAEEGRPVRVGVIGAGKFSSMFLSQARLTPGLHVVGIAELDPEKAKQACLRTGWAPEALAFGTSTASIEDGAKQGKTVITGDARQLIESRLDVIMEITGVPEAGAQHAWQALESGKHVVMVNVEADALLGPVLARKAEKAGLVYSMAYGDQPALIAEQIDWARAVGLEVVCAGKGTRYQPEYHYSTPDTVWGHYGFSEERVASGDYNAKMFNSFLDGTKSAIEMCAVANGNGLVPQRCGLQFPPVGVDELPQILKPREAGGHSRTRRHGRGGGQREPRPVAGAARSALGGVCGVPCAHGIREALFLRVRPADRLLGRVRRTVSAVPPHRPGAGNQCGLGGAAGRTDGVEPVLCRGCRGGGQEGFEARRCAGRGGRIHRLRSARARAGEP